MTNLSDCHQATVTVGGDDQEGTHYYVCDRCLFACDLKVMTSKDTLKGEIIEILDSTDATDFHWDAILTAIDKYVEGKKVTARVDELKKLLHKGVCEFKIGWSKKCDVQGESCPKTRKRIYELRKKAGLK